MEAKLILTLAILGLAANLIYAAAAPNCASHTASCGNCTYYEGCGWSISRSSCLAGNQTLSNDHTSTGIDWVWYSESCPESCRTHPTCANCTYYTSCGWSISQQSCMHGDSGGSDARDSTGSDWIWRSSGCTSASPTPTPHTITTPHITPLPHTSATPHTLTTPHVLHTPSYTPTPAPTPTPTPSCLPALALLVGGAAAVLAAARR